MMPGKTFDNKVEDIVREIKKDLGNPPMGQADRDELEGQVRKLLQNSRS